MRAGPLCPPLWHDIINGVPVFFARHFMKPFSVLSGLSVFHKWGNQGTVTCTDEVSYRACLCQACAGFCRVPVYCLAEGGTHEGFVLVHQGRVLSGLHTEAGERVLGKSVLGGDELTQHVSGLELLVQGTKKKSLWSCCFFQCFGLG